MISNEDFAKLQKLEESMWRSDTRFDPAYMDRILSADFFEVGRSGRIYNRAEILATPAYDLNAMLPLKEFRVHYINNDIVLVLYKSEALHNGTEMAVRSSIWERTIGGWQLKFHQGTPAFKY
jgi:hypothetical protein